MTIREDRDKHYIRQTFDLALKGEFTAHPNPMVGAVIVKNNKIISKGFHKHPGSPHAEQVAIKKAALFKIPSGMMAQANVAISAMCNSVSMPAKLISNRFR